MKKGDRKLKHCKYIDFSGLLPDKPEPPICLLGHGWSSDCLKPNLCLDYKSAWGRTLEATKADLAKRKKEVNE